MREMTLGYLITAMAVMIIVTYSLRAVSMILFRRKLTGKFIFSFLTYTPYGVLAALIFPDIFLFTQTGASFSVAQFVCALCGASVAVILSLMKRGLTVVSLGAVAAVFVTQQIISFI